MAAQEIPLIIDSQHNEMLAILHLPAAENVKGVLIVVGGPQYRVGSHRQFILLARYLADNGFPVMRFDYSGMGDSGGKQSSFEEIGQDIKSAIDKFITEVPSIKQLYIWGLCDAASAAMMYGFSDSRVAGMIFLNPWVRTDESEAKTYLKHYYAQRLLQGQFWKQVLKGEVNLFKAFVSFFKSIVAALGIGDRKTKELPPDDAASDMQSSRNAAIPYTERMLKGSELFAGNQLYILSGDDLTAAEFKDAVSSSRRWRKIFHSAKVSRIDFPEANHTFSKYEWKRQVEEWTLAWLNEAGVNSESA